MSDTPRTDAQYKEYARRDNDIKCVYIEFARTLERELERIRAWGNRRDEEMQHQAKLAMEARAERDEALSELNASREEVGRLMSHNASLSEALDRANEDLESTRKCLLNREESLRRSGDDWVKVKTECDQWREVAELAIASLRDAMGHIPGEHPHWLKCASAIERFENLKAKL